MRWRSPTPALQLVITEYTREAGSGTSSGSWARIARKVAARIATAPAAMPATVEKTLIDRRSGRRLPRPGPVQARGGVPDVPAGCGDRAGLDGNGRRRPLHRSDLASGRKPEHHSDRAARQRDAGVRPRRPEPPAGARDGAWDFSGLSRTTRLARARSRRRDSERRSVGWRDDGHGHPVGGAESAGAAGRGDDRRDHVERAGAARSAAYAKRRWRRAGPASRR